MQGNRLQYVQRFLDALEWNYEYLEEDGVGTIEFSHRGVPYHIWEFDDGGECGAETNVRSGGRQEELTGEYEKEIVELIKQWEGMEKVADRIGNF